MSGATGKACSICGKSQPVEQFSYGNRELRSYCISCSKAEKAAYRKGGVVAARQFRESMRGKWRSDA